jgi:AhpD family alkylhydroperoxidase
MARIDVPAGAGTEHSRIWQLAPHMGAGLNAMSKAVYEASSLPIREREVARMRIAQLNECNVCLNTRAASAMQQGLTEEIYQQVGCGNDVEELTDRERLAAEFAERFAVDHTSIGDELWGRLRAQFSDVELLELTVTIGFCVGMGRAFNVLDIARDFDVNWSREPATPR